MSALRTGHESGEPTPAGARCKVPGGGRHPKQKVDCGNCSFAALQDTDQGSAAQAAALPRGVAENVFTAAASDYYTYIFKHVYMCKYIVNNDSGPFLGTLVQAL